MSIDKSTVDYVAQLARIELQQKELDRLASQLQDILGFIDKLKKLNIENIKPTSHILPISNVLREDLTRASLGPEKALKNAPKSEGSFFVVPKVIE